MLQSPEITAATAAEVHSSPTQTEQVFVNLQSTQDPTSQWLYLQCIQWHEAPLTHIDRLLEFASDEASTSSYLVRAEAIQQAWYIASRKAYDEKRTGQPGEAAAIKEKFGAISPLVSDHEVHLAIRNPLLGTRTYAYGYDHIMGALIKAEGIPFKYIYPYSIPDHGYGSDEVNDEVPTLALLAIERLIGEEGSNVRFLPPALMREIFGKVTMALPSIIRGERSWDDLERETTFARLALQTKAGGLEHDEPVTALYRDGSVEAQTYAKASDALYTTMQQLPAAFPPEYGESLGKGSQGLIANGLFGTVQHLSQGKRTAIDLPLIGGHRVQNEMLGDKPLEIMTLAELRLRRGIGRVAGENTHIMTIVDCPEFSLFDFQDPEDYDPLQVLILVRPYGGFTVNPKYEYGTLTRGAEATIDVRIDPAPQNPYNPYTKYAQSEHAFSIRLDREGRAPDANVAIADRDVTRQQGTVSLDIGSILGRGFGFDLGSWYAEGNRRRNEVLGRPADYNHVTEAIDQAFGDADVFASIAEGYRQTLRDRSINVIR